MEMEEIRISSSIGYIEASEDPLSADVGIVQAASGTWLFDVGNGAENVSGLGGEYSVVISHFHLDHVGNLGRIKWKELYLSPETYRHLGRGTVVEKDLYIDGLHIFPIPSSHCKGCLGLETEDGFAFVGDALYSKAKDGFYVYNAQLLREEINTLKKLKAQYLLESHRKGLVVSRDEAVAMLEEIYALREKNDPYIRVRMEI